MKTDKIYSCDPATIPAWTKEKEQEFKQVLAEIFNFSSPETTENKNNSHVSANEE